MVPRNPMASHDPTVPRDPDAAAGEPDRRAEPGPVDWDHLRAVTLADPALQREVLGLFLGQSRDILAAVKGLPDDTAALAHTLKGAARAIGASEVADIAGHLDMHSIGQTPAIAHCPKLLQRFGQGFSRDRVGDLSPHVLHELLEGFLVYHLFALRPARGGVIIADCLARLIVT